MARATTYRSYTGKTNRQHISLKGMSESLRTRLIHEMKYSMRKVTERSGTKKEYKVFEAILNLLQAGKESMTARQYDNLWFNLDDKEKEEIEHLRKVGPTNEILKNLGN